MTQLTAEAQIFSELIIEIFRMNRLLLDAGDELTRPVGQSSARWQVLGVVEHGPVTVPQVSRLMGLTRQGVQRTADLLAEDGLIEFTENPHHARAKLMRLTPKGRQVLAFIEERQAEWANAASLGQPAEGLQAALALLRSLRQGLEEEHVRLADTRSNSDEAQPS